MKVREGDWGFPVMQDIIPEGKSGDWAIEHFTVSEDQARMYVMRATYSFDYLGRQLRAGDFCRLKQGNGFDSLITSDGGGERWSCGVLCSNATGNVLIAGLGIGMVLTKIISKPDVKKVIVVELSQDVINLVEKPLREYLGKDAEKLEIVLSDIYDFVPEHKYDTIWFDIWGDYSGDTYEETKVLHRKFRKYLDKSDHSFMDSWMRWHMKSLHFER